MTQDQLGAPMGQHQTKISRWESDTEPKLGVISRIEETLGLRRGDLLRRAGYVEDPRTTEDAIRSDPTLTHAAGMEC